MKTIVYFVEFTDKTVIVIEAENKQKALEKRRDMKRSTGKLLKQCKIGVESNSLGKFVSIEFPEDTPQDDIEAIHKFFISKKRKFVLKHKNYRCYFV